MSRLWRPLGEVPKRFRPMLHRCGRYQQRRMGSLDFEARWKDCEEEPGRGLHYGQIDQQPVIGARGLLNLMPGQPLVEQIAQRDVRPGCRVISHLLTQLVPD